MKFFLLAGILLIILACNMPASATRTPIPTATEHEYAWIACTLFIEQQLGISDLDAQEYAPGNVTLLAENQYAVIVHYAEQGSAYRCEILRRADGNTQLLSLETAQE